MSFFLQQHIYILLKTLEDNSLYLFYKLNQSILLINKYIKSLLLVFYYWEICIDFSTIRFYFIFRYFSLHTCLQSNSFLIMLLTVLQISLYFFNNFSSFTKKDIHYNCMFLSCHVRVSE